METFRIKMVIEKVGKANGKTTVLDSVDLPTTFQVYSMADKFRDHLIRAAFQDVDLVKLFKGEESVHSQEGEEEG